MRAAFLPVFSLLLYPTLLWAADEKQPAAVEFSRDAVANTALSTGSYVQMILGLLFIVALIFAVAWMMKRLGRFQNAMGGSMHMLGGLSLGQRERAVLIQVGKTQLLLGVAPGNVRTLHVFDEPVIVNEQSGHTGVSSGNRFADKLNAVLKQKAGM
ncbi:MAG: flagellar biosynthetic protein FliO [Gammaproteobacteria bacterium]|nr:flagellar biosynthetic protein FliO [Gammaproteobacteria bacterium]